MTISEFNTIFSEYRYIIYKYACRFVIESDAEDICSHTFIKLWQTQPTFQNKTALSQWLHLVAKNKCIDLIKIKKSHSREYYYTEISEIEDWVKDESLSLIEKEVIQHILYAVSKLPRREKEVFELKYFKYYSVPEIAKMLSVSNQTIHNYLHAAVKKLRNIIKEPSIYLMIPFALS